ncbi:hypothetical protein [Burkholderia pseudomallei]|uniref:hypothetical protein n=1 Tax=Burkholderia pseudomallei TaxID=28450 RepID=UPI000F052AAF|nr:hypothetical protein [Burkholderia pseudomallei]VBG63384.1 Uncharacterised protein [Burkholderia pseudomallei]
MTQQTPTPEQPQGDRSARPMVDVKPLIEQFCASVPAWVAQVLVPHDTFEECGQRVDRTPPIASTTYAESLWWSLLLRILRDGSGRIVVRLSLDDLPDD